jgi:hypothetical protein
VSALIADRALPSLPGDDNKFDDGQVMGKQRPKQPMNGDSKLQAMLSIKPPIHRIAANAIAKNASMNKDLMKMSLKIAAARIRPSLISSFIKEHGKEYLLPLILS